MLLAVFAVGFASDYLIVKYYNAITDCRAHRAVVFNCLIFLINVLFIDLVKVGNTVPLIVFLLGQSAGIEAAVWLEGEKIGRSAD